MLTRIRFDASGESAAQVEAHLNAAARLVENFLDLQGGTGEQVIERDYGQSTGGNEAPLGMPTEERAFKGRLVYYPNSAVDAKHIERLERQHEIV